MSVPIYAGGEQAGYATSGGLVAAAQEIHRARARAREVGPEPGTEVEMELTVEHQRKRAAARIVKKPFFDPERKRA